MRDEYDFSQGTKNPYAKPPKATVTIRLDKATVDYFKGLYTNISIIFNDFL